MTEQPHRWTRREVLGAGAGLGAAAVVAGSLPKGLRFSGAAVGGGGVTVVVPDYPFFDGTTMTEAPKVLDKLARKYARSQGSTPLSMERFLFSYVPVTVFDQIFAAGDPAADLPVGSDLWLFHLSGYFGGVWLRGELSKTGKNGALTGYSKPQTQTNFEAEVAKADVALDAARAAKGAVLDYAGQSLFDKPPAVGSTQPERGLIDTFGYNEGYLLQIAEKPPAGLSTPADFVSCPVDPGTKPLFCAYGTNRLRALHTYDSVAKKLARGQGGYAALSKKIPPIQSAGITRGRKVWDGALNVQGFSQESYEQLLDISSAFLETVQATVLATARAVAQPDVASGRKGATANAMLTLWLASYIIGITDGRPGRSLPTFEQS